MNRSTNLTDAILQTTVKNALTSGSLPTDAGGVYFVLSSSNINETVRILHPILRLPCPCDAQWR
ncbi:MAG: hypothetical protein ACXV8M_12880 [Candidatus Angelobacter sp.]